MATNKAATLEEELQHAVPGALVVWTDGRGSVTAASDPGPRGTSLAREVDLARMFVTALGVRQKIGAPGTVVLTYEHGTLVAMRAAAGGHLAILADRGTTVGLLLSYAQKLVAAHG